MTHVRLEWRSQSNLRGKKAITPHDRRLQITPQAKPEASRHTLRGEAIVARTRAGFSNCTLLGKSRRGIDEGDRAFIEKPQGGKSAGGELDDTQASKARSVAAHQLKGLLVHLVLLPHCLADGMQMVSSLTMFHVRRAQRVNHNIVGEVVDVLVPGLVNKKHIATPLI